MSAARNLRIQQLRRDGMKLREICEELDVSKSAVNRALYPAVREGERELNRRRQRGTCRVCGQPCSWNRYLQAQPRCADCYHRSQRHSRVDPVSAPTTTRAVRTGCE